MKLNPMTRVFVAPNRMRKFLFVDFMKEVPITAACPLPIPGRKLQRGAENVEAKTGLINDFNLGFIFDIFCSGIFVLFFILMIKEDVPKSPERRGRKGWLIFEFRTAIPKNPARVKVISACSFLFSLSIKKVEAAIKRKGIRSLIVVSIFGRMIIKKGEIKRMMKIADRLP